MGHEVSACAGRQVQGWTVDTYRSGWMLTRSKPKTCKVLVSCLSHAALRVQMQHTAGKRTSAFRNLLHAELASRARHTIALQGAASQTYSAMSIGQMPVPVPRSRMRTSPCCGTGAWCSMSLRATENILW